MKRLDKIDIKGKGDKDWLWINFGVEWKSVLLRDSSDYTIEIKRYESRKGCSILRVVRLHRLNPCRSARANSAGHVGESGRICIWYPWELWLWWPEPTLMVIYGAEDDRIPGYTWSSISYILPRVYFPASGVAVSGGRGIVRGEREGGGLRKEDWR